MKARANEVSIAINRDEALEIQNQILQLCDDSNINLHSELPGTALGNLFKLLNGNFEAATRGVNFI